MGRVRDLAARATGHAPARALALRGRARVASGAGKRALRDRRRDPGNAGADRAALVRSGRKAFHRCATPCGRSRRRRCGRSRCAGVLMTVTAAPPHRLVVDLGADATILDAARRLAAADPGQDVVLVVPAGAPLTRNAAFLDVLNRRAGANRLVMVSSDARARSLASSVHLRAFASLAALERHELDATEHLSDARRVALATIAAVGAQRVSLGRALAVFISLLMAAGILIAVVAPSATVVLAANASPLGPSEYDLRAGPNGDIKATSQTVPVTAKTSVKPTGTRTDDTKAQGVERFTNGTTSDILIGKGTVVRTSDGIRFQTTEDKTLPHSTLLPILNISMVNISIQAVDPGPSGNVPPQKINVSPSPNYTVTNPVETLGGDSKKIQIVQQADYDIAVAQSDLDLKKAGDEQTKVWQSQASRGSVVYGAFVKRTSVSPPGDVVGKEAKEGATTFEITVNGTATGYTVVDTEPKATAVSKLGTEVQPGMDLVRDGAVVDVVIPASVAEDGVHWRVRARAQQSTRPRPQMTAALAGRDINDVGNIARDAGFELVRIEAWPAWWPRLPVLDSRITIKVESSVSSGPP
ncbi:MAG: hypothetical protein E6J09_12460 [Chloroflexi bacterium]|nr:MAG: hypothetical protein E6J09_12460 [Chloroflexota bacterium]